MNIILFDADELARPLPRADRRAVHVLNVLHRKPGDTFDAGVINGARGKATLIAITDEVIELQFNPVGEPVSLAPITLIVGMVRPQTARDVLRDATSLGVRAIHFVSTEKTERSYASSSLWTSGEWRRHVLHGAEQAFDTRVPAVTCDESLADAAAKINDAERIALDNYEASAALGTRQAGNPAITLAVGPERGWSARDRDVLRAHRFNLYNLGERVLRTETAVTAALAILRAQNGLM